MGGLLPEGHIQTGVAGLLPPGQHRGPAQPAGVQRKTSASMLTTPLELKGRRYLLKLDPPEHPHLVENEAAHLRGPLR